MGITTGLAPNTLESVYGVVGLLSCVCVVLGSLLVAVKCAQYTLLCLSLVFQAGTAKNVSLS